MELKDIVPRQAKIKLSVTGKTYMLRPISLADDMWMSERFGANLKMSLDEGNMRTIAAIIYNQLEDKTDFLEQEVEIIDAEGKKKTYMLGGEKLLFSMIIGAQEKIALYTAMCTVIGVSKPVVDEIMESMVPSDPEKKSPKKKQTGQRSLTSLHRSMVGQRNTRSRARSGKSIGG